MNKEGILLVMSGPSGAGKSSVISRVRKLYGNLAFSVSATTRKPRPGEIDGKDYYFVSPEQFAAMVADGQLLEYAQFVGNFYGTPKAPVLEKLRDGISVILDIEVQGAAQVMKAMPDAVSVFLAPPSLEELERRLRGRGTESEEKIRQRLETAKIELLQQDKYDYIVVNDDPDRAARELLHILETGRKKKL